MEHTALTLRYTNLTNIIFSEAGVFLPFEERTSEKLKKFRAIWDTGATNTAITKKVVDALDLKPIDKAEINTSNGKREANVYLIDLVLLPTGLVVEGVRVSEVDLAPDADILIGMDIIKLGSFAITSEGGKSCMSFRIPSRGHIDFVPETERHNAARNDRKNKWLKPKKRSKKKH